MMTASSESLDVEFARDRLDNLLKNIRSHGRTAASTPTGTATATAFTPGTTNGKRPADGRGDEDEQDASDYETAEGDDQQGSKKRRRRSQKKIIFELRQKAFEIQNPSIEHGLYALCRIWMRGKDNKDAAVLGQPIDRSRIDFSQESLLAAKAITRKSTVQPESKRKDTTTVTGEEEKASDILNQYLQRWRKAKKEWCQQRNRNDAERYGDSLRVLREMYATAQSHVINI